MIDTGHKWFATELDVNVLKWIPKHVSVKTARDGGWPRRENYGNVPNMATKAKCVHELLPTACLCTVASVEAKRLPGLRYADASGKAVVTRINLCVLETSTFMTLLPEWSAISDLK